MNYIITGTKFILRLALTTGMYLILRYLASNRIGGEIIHDIMGMIFLFGCLKIVDGILFLLKDALKFEVEFSRGPYIEDEEDK